MRPFECPVTILNTLDYLGKFDGKADEEFFVGYSTNNKAFRVFNSRTRIVEKNLHVKFSEETPNIVGNGPNWLYDIDALTKSMNYKSVVAGNQTNGNAGTKENIDAAGKKIVSSQEYILLPFFTSDQSLSKGSKDSPDDGFKPLGGEENKDYKDPRNKDSEVPSTKEPRINQEKDANVNNTNNINTASDGNNTNNVNTISSTVNAAGLDDNVVDENIVYGFGAEADMNNLAITVPVSPIPTTRVNKDHLLEQVIRDIHSTPQTRRMTKNVTEHVEPKKVWTLMDLPHGKRAIGTKWVYRNNKDERGIVIRNKARIEAIRLFLAYASFKDFVVYKMDMKSAFLYGKIKEVYVYQPLGFEDPEFPDKVYKVEKALYGLHQTPRAWYETLSTYLLDNGFQRGLQVTQKDDGIFVSQDKYMGEILKKFVFLTVKTASTPIETSKPLLKDAEAEDVDVQVLLWRLQSHCSKMQKLKIFQVTPKVLHLYAVKRIFRYLKGNPQQRLSISWKQIDFMAMQEANLVANSTTKERIDDWNGLEMLRMKLGLKLCCQAKVNAARLLTTARLPLELQLLRVFLVYKRNTSLIENADFDEIVDFLNANPIRYALTVSPTIYVSYIEQFWSTAKIKIVNNERQIRAKVNGKTIVISESSVRRDLQFNDEDDETIHEERGDGMERVASTAASLNAEQESGNIIRTQSMATLNEPIPQETGSEVNTPGSGEDRLKIMELMEICTKLSDRVLALENVKTAQDLEITGLKKKVKKLEKKKKARIPQLKRRLFKVRIESSVDKRLETQGRYDHDIDVTTVSAPITTAGVSVSTAEPSTPPTTTTVIEDEDLTIAQTLMKMRSEKSKEKAKERGSKEKSNETATRPTRGVDYAVTRRSNFAKLRAEKIRRKPPTKAQKRNQMSTYLRNMFGYKHTQLKNKSFKEIQMLFDKEMKRVNLFVPMDSEVVKGSGKKTESSRKETVSKKRAGEELDEESVKRQKLEDDAEKAELQLCLEIVPIDDEAINIIRADGSEKYYKIFSAMLDNFDRQDVLDPYRLVKKRFETASPEGYDRLLWGDFITLFEPTKEDEIWKAQQDYTLISWRLFDVGNLLLCDDITELPEFIIVTHTRGLDRQLCIVLRRMGYIYPLWLSIVGRFSVICIVV
ncbi:putative ribonuclease H-like domain-containing protein [Tanacetum coccineum]